MYRLASFDNSSFDRGASRLKEWLWVFLKIIVLLSPVPFPSSLKVLLLRCFGAVIGKGVVIRPRVNITFPWRVSIGDDVWIGEEVLILSLAPVTIGSDVCISQRAFLCTGSHDYHSATFDLVTEPIVVESQSWIAAQAFVAPGVTISSGSVVAGGSVVVNDVPPDSIVAGNPAKVLRTIERKAPPGGSDPSL